MSLITTCPGCGRSREIDPQANFTTCPRCRTRYNVWGTVEDSDPPITHEPDPDYGGAFDGHTVFSDADPSL
ncbi:MAG: hypothetical protein E6Q97_18985 [Desulfurellales bacterium]|nr:MAG: hypothetical protein E6Q97_18985 [Desulfurellales bacterium]